VTHVYKPRYMEGIGRRIEIQVPRQKVQEPIGNITNAIKGCGCSSSGRVPASQARSLS
jgi:hypothetical protein